MLWCPWRKGVPARASFLAIHARLAAFRRIGRSFLSVFPENPSVRVECEEATAPNGLNGVFGTDLLNSVRAVRSLKVRGVT